MTVGRRPDFIPVLVSYSSKGMFDLASNTTKTVWRSYKHIYFKYNIPVFSGMFLAVSAMPN